MNSDQATICEAVAESVNELVDSMRSLSLAAQLIDPFWNLQDPLNRLVERADEFPQEVFALLRTRHSGLISALVNALQTAETLRLLERRPFANRAPRSTRRCLSLSI
jgi:hypothetical protein